MTTERQVTPIGAQAAAALPLAELPAAIRRMADEKHQLAREWANAFGNYKERRRSLALYFHRDQNLGITAAEMQAEIDPNVIEAGEYSRSLRDQLQAFETAERHLQQELDVKLALARINGAA